MPSLADEIQAFIVTSLGQGGGEVTLRRADLAERFGCAPSQISYVLETRFSLERGFRVESRRGGGGYVRIGRLAFDGCANLVARLDTLVGDRIGEDGARGVIAWLHREDFVDRRGAAVMEAAIRRETIALPLPLRDEVRARCLKAMARAAVALGPAGPAGGAG